MKNLNLKLKTPRSNLTQPALAAATRPRQKSRLRFLPTAWAKLLYFRDRGETEIGGFGLTKTADPLLVTDVQLVKQTCSWVTVSFDDEAVANFFEEQVDRGLQPHQFARLWIHTHPGHSASPSATDERTFARVFGAADWSVMFILAQAGETYCRLQFTAGPGGVLELPVEVDYSHPFAASDWSNWDKEYLQAVQVLPEFSIGLKSETAKGNQAPTPFQYDNEDLALAGYDDVSSWLFE